MNPETLKDLLTLKHCWLGWLDVSKQPPMPLETEGMDCQEVDSDSEAGDAVDPSTDHEVENENDEQTVVIEEE
jgi:hypothetical protein